MTKKETQQWLKEEGFSTSYSGHDKTMYVHGISQERLDSFGLSVKFKLIAQ